MPTAAIAGFVGEVFISDAGAPADNKIGELREMTLTLEHEAIDATSHDSARWREFIDGLRSWSVSAEALYVDGDAGQDDILAILLGDQNAAISFRPEGSTVGDAEFSGVVKVTSFELTGPNDDAAAVSIEAQGTGALTKGTVS